MLCEITLYASVESGALYDTRGVTIVAAVYDFVADDKEEFDTQDVHRVQSDTEYVSKFVRQVGVTRTKPTTCWYVVCAPRCARVCECVCMCVCTCVYVLPCILCPVQVEAMKWRKSFGANGMTTLYHSVNL